MAVATEEINFDLHDNKGFAFTDDDVKEEELVTKLSNDVAESSFQVTDHDKKTLIVLKKTQDELRNIIIACIVFGISVAIALVFTIYFGPPQVIPHGVVSSRTGLCSDTGSTVLKAGGSAADASIAIILCESILDQSIFMGCGVVTYHDQRKNYSYSLDFSCSNAKSQMNPKDSVMYPTLMRGLAALHDKLGVMKLKDILQLVTESFQSGHSIPTPLVGLFTELATKGLDYFYDYPHQVNWTGNETISLNDAKSFVLTADNPQRIIFRENSLESVRSDSSLSMFMLMKIMENLTTSGRVKWNSTDFYHYFVEAAKLVEINLQNITRLKTNDEWSSLSSYITSFIKEDEALTAPAPEKQVDIQTLRVSIIGPKDNLISAAITQNSSESSKQDTSIVLVAHNLVKPCALRMAATSSNYIGLTQVLIRYLSRAMDLTKAMTEPKLYPTGNIIFYEENFEDDVIKMLIEKGHLNLLPFNKTTKIYMDTVWKDGEILGSCINTTLNNISIF